MGHNVLSQLMEGHPTVVYFIAMLFLFHIGALGYWMYSILTEQGTGSRNGKKQR